MYRFFNCFSIFYIFLLTSVVFPITATAQSNEDFRIINNAGRGGMITGYFDKQGKSAPPINRGVWSSNQWGTRYLINAFNLTNYKPSEKSVYVARGLSFKNAKSKYEEATHYIRHPSNNKICIVHFVRTWKKTNTEIYATLIGCHVVSLP